MNCVWIKFLCGILFIVDVVLINLYGIGVWVIGSIWFYYWVYCYQVVIFVIYIQIEVEIINMLVCSIYDIVIDKCVVVCVIFRCFIVYGFCFNIFYCFDVCSIGIDVNSVVFMEDLVKNVVIVIYCIDLVYY